MRPIAKDQDYIRAPLDEILGTPASVRLIRLLADGVSGSISAPEASEKTGLTEAGARRALKRLARTGFVEQLGGGRAKRFRLNDADPLSGHLRVLFHAEYERHMDFVSRLREVLGGFPEIQVAWIDEAPTEAGHPLHIGFIAGVRALAYLSTEVRKRIVGIEEAFDIVIEIHPFSRAEAPDVPWETTVLLAGHQTGAAAQGNRGTTSHSTRLDRSVRISAAIAELLDRDPSLLRRAERHIELLLAREEGPASHDIQEWHGILAHYSRQRIKDFLVSDSARAQRLRQSSPFFAVLNVEEREVLLDVLEARQ